MAEIGNSDGAVCKSVMLLNGAVHEEMLKPLGPSETGASGRPGSPGTWKRRKAGKPPCANGV